MAQEQSAPAPQRRAGPLGIFWGWWIVAGGSIHSFIGYGSWLYSWSVFVRPLMTEFKLTASQMALSRTVGAGLAIPLGPFGGWLIERFGPRVQANLSFTLVGVGFIMLALVPNPELGLAFIIVGYGIFIYSGMMLGIYAVSHVWATKWFIKRRGIAMSFITGFVGVGSIILIPATQAAELNLGWRGAAIATGVLSWVIGVAVATLMFPPHPPEYYGLRPDNVSEEEYRRTQEAAMAGRVSDRLQDVSLGLGQAMRLWAFWGMAIGMIFYGFAVIGVSLFQNIAMQEAGYTPMEAAGFYSANFVFSMIGRFSAVLYSDRVNPRWMIVGIFLIIAYGLYSFGAVASGPFWLWSWVVLYGWAHGTNQPFQPLLRAYYFGRGSFGHIFGWLMGIINIGGVLAPMVIGVARDITGSYQAAFTVCAVSAVIAALFFVFTPRPSKTLAQLGVAG